MSMLVGEQFVYVSLAMYDSVVCKIWVVFDGCSISVSIEIIPYWMFGH